jgi:hypothetical protein
LYIPGYGYCTAQDTGAFRHEEGGAKNQIDVFLNTEKNASDGAEKIQCDGLHTQISDFAHPLVSPAGIRERLSAFGLFPQQGAGAELPCG